MLQNIVCIYTYIYTYSFFVPQMTVLTTSVSVNIMCGGKVMEIIGQFRPQIS